MELQPDCPSTRASRRASFVKKHWSNDFLVCRADRDGRIHRLPLPVGILYLFQRASTIAIVSVPPQLFPKDPTLDNYLRVWNQLPVWRILPQQHYRVDLQRGASTSVYFAGGISIGQNEIPRARC